MPRRAWVSLRRLRSPSTAPASPASARRSQSPSRAPAWGISIARSMSNRARAMSTTKSAQGGFTLVELVLFIAVLGIALGGVLVAYDHATRDAADPLVRKQALAIAEALLEEVQQMPFTYCDPDDPAVTTAASPAACAIPEALGPEASETRYSTTTPFD